jgi:hypothetical protein
MGIDTHKALALFLSDPMDFILIFAAVVAAVAIFVWWLRGHMGSKSVDALEERFDLAHDQHGIVERQIAQLKAKVARQDNLIAAFGRLQSPPTRPMQELLMGSSEVKTYVTNLARLTNDLGATLKISGTKAVFSPPGKTRIS